ncbi:protein DGS1, mitochondrial-like isoform X2 [Aristolochia californica]|uniref:protein DGS1, mitochondrial-like isoform X2 n=1 Tax=Aristolochia californica TaxID=171875 RepID=UPI0035DB11A2
MADLQENSKEEISDVKPLISFYSCRLREKLVKFLPTPRSSFFARITNPFSRGTYSRYKRRKPSLPLPLSSTYYDTSLTLGNTSNVLDIIEDIMGHILSRLHHIQKSLLFWQSRAEGTDKQKVYFMVFERGPWAFIEGSTQLLRGFATEGYSMQHLCHSANFSINERIAVLTGLQKSLAMFLAQLYTEVDKFGEALMKDPDKSLPVLLMTINNLFSKLEASIDHLQLNMKNSFPVPMDESKSLYLQLEKLPEINKDTSQWTDCEVRDAINSVNTNLRRLDSYLSVLVSKYQKPRRMTVYWLRYTCGAVGLSVCSVWLLRHSSLMGSPDIDNWIHEAKESTVSFWKDHVEQPIISIRDELFETFRTRHKGVMELEEVRLTEDSLHKMLLAFSKQTEGVEFPEDTSDQALLEIVMARYEKELMHPIKNFLGGEIVRAFLIQIQKLKFDIETAMLELDQILKANEINFAILAALPAFILCLLLIMLARVWLIRDTGAEGKGRTARLQRRLLLVEVEKRIMQIQNCVDQGLDEDGQCMFGLLLYSLDRLFKAVERHAKETGEWCSLRQDILDVAKPKVTTAYKMVIASRMERVYDCLLPSTKRR